MWKLRKNCNRKRNINGMYNEQLHYNFKTKDRKLGDFGKKETKYPKNSLSPRLRAKNSIS